MLFVRFSYAFKAVLKICLKLGDEDGERGCV
jgi:hypothetical protein